MAKAGIKVADFIRQQETTRPSPVRPALGSVRPTEVRITISTKKTPIRGVQPPPEPSTAAPKAPTPVPIDAENDRTRIFKVLDAHAVADPLKLLDFVRWCAIPMPMRKPTTQREFADEIGIDETTLTRWKWLVGFWDEVATYRERVLRSHTTDIIYALIKEAKKGNVQAAKLYLELFEGHTDRIRVATDEGGFSSDEERGQFERAASLAGHERAKAVQAAAIEAFKASEREDSI